MKYKILITIAILLSFNSCKKDDYRDEFVGVYYGLSTCILHNIPPIEDSIHITISKLEDNKLALYEKETLLFSCFVEVDGTFKKSEPNTLGFGKIMNNYLDCGYSGYCFFNGIKQ